MAEQKAASQVEVATAPGTRQAAGQVTIHATPERVWQAVTEAAELERWFPLEARVEPGAGGRLWMSWRNEFAGEMEILVWDPPRHLRTSWSFGEGEQPAQITDYLIEGKGGVTTVRAVTSGFPLDASWDGWVEGTVRGWAFELRSLRHYLERHAGEPRHVVYLRRRVPVSRDEAWSRLQADHELGPLLRAGDPFDQAPASQYAAVIDDPADALLRLSVEPGGPGADAHEVVLWLSAWGDAHAARVHELRAQWSRALERLYPEGTTP